MGSNDLPRPDPEDDEPDDAEVAHRAHEALVDALTAQAAVTWLVATMLNLPFGSIEIAPALQALRLCTERPAFAPDLIEETADLAVRLGWSDDEEDADD